MLIIDSHNEGFLMTILSYQSKRVGTITISTDSKHITIRTDRLVFKSLNQHDRDDIITHYTKLMGEPENIALYGEGLTWDKQKVTEFIDDEINKWNDNKRFCSFSAHDAMTDEFMGDVQISNAFDLFSHVRESHRHAAEIGYILDKKFWGKGFGTELAIVAKIYVKHLIAESELDDLLSPLEEIVATAHPENHGSVSILRKTLKHQETTELRCYGDKPRILFFKSLRKSDNIELPLKEKSIEGQALP